MPESFAELARSVTDHLPSLQDFLLYLLMSFVLSKPLAWVYVATHHGMSYSRSFVQSLVILAMVVTIVMLAIGDSLARAFGLFGALALIRFRTPIKDTRDTAFLFLSVAIGIAVGAHQLLLAVVGVGFALLVCLYLDRVRFGERMGRDGVLRFRMPATPEQEALLRRVLGHYCRTFALMHLREGADDAELEYAYQLQLHDPSQVAGLVADVRAIPGASAVMLLAQDEHQEL